MTKLTDSLWACLLNLEEHHSRVDGWRPSDGATPYLYLLYREVGEVVASKIEVPAWAWGASDSLGGFLRRTGTLLSQHRAIAARLFDPTTIGVGLVCEGWGLSANEEQEFERVAKSRRIHQHPNRRETRLVLATLLTGSTVFTVVRYRRFNEILKFPDGGNPEVEGGVPDGLRFLAQTVLVCAS